MKCCQREQQFTSLRVNDLDENTRKLRHKNGRKLRTSRDESVVSGRQQVQGLETTIQQRKETTTSFFNLNKLVETLNKLVDTLEDVKELSEGIRRISSRLNNRVIDK